MSSPGYARRSRRGAAATSISRRQFRLSFRQSPCAIFFAELRILEAKVKGPVNCAALDVEGRSSRRRRHPVIYVVIIVTSMVHNILIDERLPLLLHAWCSLWCWCARCSYVCSSTISHTRYHSRARISPTPTLYLREIRSHDIHST